MHHYNLSIGFAALLVVLTGCGSAPTPVVGGTPGVLRCGGQLLGEMHVGVHRAENGAFRPVGFGETAADGSFRLYTTGAQGPLVLAPGEYRFTLQSAGAPVQIPKTYFQPETTPLRVTWSAGETNLTLEADVKLSAR